MPVLSPRSHAAHAAAQASRSGTSPSDRPGAEVSLSSFFEVHRLRESHRQVAIEPDGETGYSSSRAFRLPSASRNGQSYRKMFFGRSVRTYNGVGAQGASSRRADADSVGRFSRLLLPIEQSHGSGLLFEVLDHHRYLKLNSRLPPRTTSETITNFCARPQLRVVFVSRFFLPDSSKWRAKKTRSQY